MHQLLKTNGSVIGSGFPAFVDKKILFFGLEGFS